MRSGKPVHLEYAILQHIARYRLTFKEIVGHLFFGGADPQKRLDKLRQDGLLRTEKGFVGNRSSYQLTPKGAKFVDVNRRRGEPLGSEALAVHFGVLAFCCLNQRPRLRMEEEELAELFGGSISSSGCHVVEQSTKASRVYRVYVPGPGTRVNEIILTTRKHVHEALKTPSLDRWITHEVYSHAILVESLTRAAELRAALDEAAVDDSSKLGDVAHIHVECVPGPEKLEEALDALAEAA